MASITSQNTIGGGSSSSSSNNMEVENDNNNDNNNSSVVDEDQQHVKDEYNIWKKNVPFLYDYMLSHALEWPSLTCQWLPDTFDEETDSTITRQLLLGSHVAEGKGDNELLISTVTLPKNGTDWQDIKEDAGDEEKGIAGGRLKIVKRFKHDGEVNRVRFNYGKKNLAATKSPSGKVYIYDVSKPDGSSHVCVCNGHTQEGFGIAWSPTGNQDQLVSAGNDGLVCLWKISGNAKNVQPLGVFQGHDGRVVEDVSWNCENPHQFVSVGDDQSIVFWDTRERTESHKINAAHDSPINCVDFHPKQASLLLTGASDGSYRLWDTRVLSATRRKWIHSMPKIHKEDVLSLQWNPDYSPGFATTSGDRRVIMYDLSRIGEEQPEEDAKDGPPEMLFLHSGHTANVNDISFRKGDGWLCATVSDDNIVQVWEMGRKLYEMEALTSALRPEQTTATSDGNNSSSSSSSSNNAAKS